MRNRRCRQWLAALAFAGAALVVLTAGCGPQRANDDDAGGGSDMSGPAVCPSGPLPSLLHPRVYASAVFVGTSLYVFGGYDGPDSAKKMVGSVEKYDPASKEWVEVTTMPLGRAGMAAGVVGTRVALIGGFDPVTDRVDLFDTATSSWSSGARMPAPDCNLASSTSGDEVFVSGGYDGSGVRAYTYAYNVSTNAWRTGAPMTKARDRAASAIVGAPPILYVAGGQAYGSNQFSTVEAYDIAANTWATGPGLLQARSNHTMAKLGDRLYVLGGSYQGAGTFVDTVETLRPGEAAWTAGKKLASLRDMATAAVCGDAVYLLGGRNPQAVPVGTVEIYLP